MMAKGTVYSLFGKWQKKFIRYNLKTKSGMLRQDLRLLRALKPDILESYGLKFRGGRLWNKYNCKQVREYLYTCKHLCLNDCEECPIKRVKGDFCDNELNQFVNESKIEPFEQLILNTLNDKNFQKESKKYVKEW